MDTPGLNGTTFIITFSEDWFPREKAIINVVITKVYKRTLWRRILYYFGFKIKWFKCTPLGIVNK